MSNFIGIYDNILTSKTCQFIIEEFEKDPGKKPGIISIGGYDVVAKSQKDSTDLTLSFFEGSELTNSLSDGLAEGTEMYCKEYPEVDSINNWTVFPSFNIQKYLPGQGFHNPHCESDSSGNPRVLAWMFYLNTVTDGGETRFPSYDLNVQPVEGRLVIWPAYFTHIHHGIVSSTQTKYIATGWHAFY